MNAVAQLAVLVGLSGVALTLLGLAAAQLSSEPRRIRRGLTRVLKGAPHAELVAPGRGRAVGFNFTENILAVTWDAGAWCLIYRVDELVGAELIIDGQVVGRVHRGEARRAPDRVGGAEASVCLRLVFDDPANPDFELELWSAADSAARKRGSFTAAGAVQEANRWLARTESLLRRPILRKEAFGPMVARTQPLAPTVAPAPTPLFDDPDDPPFEIDSDDEDEVAAR